MHGQLTRSRKRSHLEQVPASHPCDRASWPASRDPCSPPSRSATVLTRRLVRAVLYSRAWKPSANLRLLDNGIFHKEFFS